MSVSSSNLAQLPPLTVVAGPMDAAWEDRLKEELVALVTLVEMNADNGTEWFNIEPTDERGIVWAGSCWTFYEHQKYEFRLQFEIPATYPAAPIEIELPELDGLIADVQYADVDDVENHNKTALRRYRKALTALHNGVTEWIHEKVDFVVDMGDAIDGYRNETRAQGISAIQRIMHEWRRLHIPVLHLVGNHELYKFTRKELLAGVEGFHCSVPETIPSDAPEHPFYYSFTAPNHPEWRMVILDPYEESVITNGGGRMCHELTLENGGLNKKFSDMCQANNPNDIYKTSNYFTGLQGEAARWAPFNGGLGKRQLQWLETVLSDAKMNNEQIIVFSHVILHPRATPNGNCHTLLWDYDKVLAIFAKYTPCVKMVFAGHAHHNGYFRCPETGIQHVSLPSPLEAPEGQVEETFATLEVHGSTRAVLKGHGYVESREFDLTEI